MSPRVARPSLGCCRGGKGTGLRTAPRRELRAGRVWERQKEFWERETSEEGTWGRRESGRASLKGPDCRPELESDVWESGAASSSCSPRPPTPYIWASLGGEQTDGKVEKEEGGRGQGYARRWISVRRLESETGHCVARRVWQRDEKSWEGRGGREAWVLTPLPLQGSCTLVV